MSATSGIKAAIAEQTPIDHSKWRDLTEKEIKAEASSKKTALIVGLAIMAAATLLIYLTATGKLDTFTHITDDYWSRGHHIVHQWTGCDGFITYGTYSVAAIVGISSFCFGLFHDAESSKYPYNVVDTWDRTASTSEFDVALARLQQQTDINYLTYYLGVWDETKRRRNLGPLVRSGHLTPDQVQQIDTIFSLCESSSRTKVRDILNLYDRGRDKNYNIAVIDLNQFTENSGTGHKEKLQKMQGNRKQAAALWAQLQASLNRGPNIKPTTKHPQQTIGDSDL